MRIFRSSYCNSCIVPDCAQEEKAEDELEYMCDMDSSPDFVSVLVRFIENAIICITCMTFSDVEVL